MIPKTCQKNGKTMVGFVLLGLLLLASGSETVWADGTETLGPPSIPIAAGTGMAIGGVGLAEGQPQDLAITVPGDINGSPETLNLLLWTFVNRTNDNNVTVDTNGTQLVINVPGGTPHAPDPVNNAPSLMQSAPNTDLFLEVKFDSEVTLKYQEQGLVVEEDADTFIRFDVDSDGVNVKVFSGSFDGGAKITYNYSAITPGAPYYLRVERVGDDWTHSYSPDGINWTVVANYTFVLNVSSAGFFAGNEVGATSPAFTCLVDYFHADAPLVSDEFNDSQESSIQQVLLYWSGFFLDAISAPDTMTIQVEGLDVTGARIGGPTFFFGQAFAATYRADITDLDLVQPGDNLIAVGGLSFNRINHGAGILVIFDDGSEVTDIVVRDGTDTAFINFPEPRMTTVEQIYSFPPSPTPRTAHLSIFTASVQGDDLPTARPSVIKVTPNNGAPQVFPNLLGSIDGKEWDSVLLTVNVPAGAASLAVQVLSEDTENTGNLPASLVWLNGTLSLVLSEVVCTGELGDFVWHDLNGNGLQDEGEPGLAGVRVILQNGDVQFLADTVTDSDGKYQFDELCAGDYIVVVDETTLPAGAAPTQSLAGDPADDSNGSPANVTLPADDSQDLTIDFGYAIEQPPCEVEVSVIGCIILDQDDDDCDDDDDDDNDDDDDDGNHNGQYKWLQNNLSKWTDSHKWNNKNWQNYLKQSKQFGNDDDDDDCNDDDDDDGDDDDDCDDDDNDHGDDNEVCLTEIPFFDNCCQGEVKVLELRYTGEGCDASSHTQDPKKVLCSGDPAGAEPVKIVVTNKTGRKLWASQTDVFIGDIIVAAAANDHKDALDGDTVVKIYSNSTLLQTVQFHTSCSQPLNPGDQFASMEIVAMETTKGGFSCLDVDVEYTYTIFNPGSTPLTNVTVIDDVFGEVPGSPIPMIAAGESVILTLIATITDATTNTVLVTANDGACTAEASAAITREQAPPPPTDCTTKISAMLLKYIGPTILDATVKFYPKNKDFVGSPVVYEHIDLISGVTILSSPAENNFTIDSAAHDATDLGAKTTIFINNQEEVIHTSCSTPFVKDQPAPLNNPIGDPSPNWFVVDFRQK